METFFLVFYVLPFLVVVAMPGWRSLLVVVGAAAIFLGYLWIDITKPDFDGGPGGFLANIFLFFITVSVASAIAARSLLLATGREALWGSGSAIVAALFFGPPLLIYLVG